MVGEKKKGLAPVVDAVTTTTAFKKHLSPLIYFQKQQFILTKFFFASNMHYHVCNIFCKKISLMLTKTAFI